MLSGEGNENGEKTTIGLISKKQLCPCSTLFLYISLPLFCTTTTWNFQKHILVTRFLEEMSYVFSFTFFFTAVHFLLALVAASISHAYRWILVYICCLISTDLSLSDEANIMKFLNLKEHNNFSYLWKFEPDGPNSFGEILFEKPQNLQSMYELNNVLPPSNFAVFSCCYFLCFWLHELHKSTSTFNFWTLLLHTATSSNSYANEQKCKQWRHDQSPYNRMYFLFVYR